MTDRDFPRTTATAAGDTAGLDGEAALLTMAKALAAALGKARAGPEERMPAIPVRISELEASLVNAANSRTARASQSSVSSQDRGKSGQRWKQLPNWA